MKVVDHVKWRASIGHGLDWHMLGLLLQELFLALKLANPARVTGLEDVGQLPTSIWIRRFADPTSEEWKAILDRPAAPEPKKKKPEPKKKKPAAKEKKPVKKKTAVNQIKSMLIQWNKI